MTTEQTLDEIADIFAKVMERVEGTGAQQYSLNEDTRQAFQDKPNDAIVRDTLEEIQDAIAYLSFLHIKVEAMLRWAK